MSKKIKIDNRRSVFSEIGDYCLFSKKDDFIEVTEWVNGDGFDITISDKQIFSLTRGEFDLIKVLINRLNQ
jgi:hypothetical protein